MDLPFGAGRKLALAFSGWFGGAKANAATNGQPITSTNVFPQLIEVIPGRLKVRIFLHEIEYEKETFSCWSYVTDGLVAQKQKEMIFTLRRDPRQKPEDYPSELLELFVTIFHYAERGQLVDVGQSTLFGETGFFGNSYFRGSVTLNTRVSQEWKRRMSRSWRASSSRTMRPRSRGISGSLASQLCWE